MNEEHYYNYGYQKNKKLRQLRKNKLVIVIMIVLIVLILLIVTQSMQGSIQTTAISIDKEIKETELANKEKEKAEEKAEIQKIADEMRKEKAKIEEQEKAAKLPNLTTVGKENMKNIYKSEKKRAFLTFDDGPSNNTAKILDTLKKENATATFFMLGSNVKIFPNTVRRVYNEGHYIANHGYSHNYSSIYSSPQAVLDEYNKCNAEVRKVLGEPEYSSHLFRFPGGLAGGKYAKIKQKAKELLEKNDILNIDWNALTGDAESQKPKASNLMKKLKETTKGKNSVVILMHDAEAKKVTADMLQDIIKYLKEQNYELKNFYDIIK